MRVLVRAFVCAALLMSAAACDPTRKTYFSEGVGVDLYQTESISSLPLQNDYLNRLCEQAAPACSSTATPDTWRTFVRAGMNDIDERCDGYLTWLDGVRRSQAPFGKQITDTGTATNLIMQATSASVGSMAVVAAAFGLASNSFTNLQSRLLFEVPHSTVQAVVLSRQKEYREDLFGTDTKRGVIIPDRPSAIYALRSYLRLCMPITIEMEINNTVAAFERGGTAALTNSKTQFISAKSVGITDANAPLRKFQPPAPPPGRVSIGPYEARMTQKDMDKALEILGCPGKDLGPAGSNTRKALTKFLTDNGKSAPDRLTVDSFIDLREIGKKGTCSI